MTKKSVFLLTIFIKLVIFSQKITGNTESKHIGRCLEMRMVIIYNDNKWSKLESTTAEIVSKASFLVKQECIILKYFDKLTKKIVQVDSEFWSGMSGYSQWYYWSKEFGPSLSSELSDFINDLRFISDLAKDTVGEFKYTLLVSSSSSSLTDDSVLYEIKLLQIERSWDIIIICSPNLLSCPKTSWFPINHFTFVDNADSFRVITLAALIQNPKFDAIHWLKGYYGSIS